MITYIGHDKYGRYYNFQSEGEKSEFDNYWNSPSLLERGQEVDGNGCRGMVVGASIVLFILALILSALFGGCAPAPQPRLKQNPNITPYEYQLNSKRNIKRKYRKAFAPKKSLRPSLK